MTSRAAIIAAASLLPLGSALGVTFETGNCTVTTTPLTFYTCAGGSVSTLNPSETIATDEQGVCNDPTAGFWIQTQAVTALTCTDPITLADYWVDESQVAALLSAIVGLMALAVTIRLVRDVIRGRR